MKTPAPRVSYHKKRREVAAHWRERLWTARPASEPARLGLGLLRLVAAVLRDMFETRFDERAASLSYTALLGFAPMLAVVFAVLNALGAHDALEPVLRGFLEPLGAGAEDVTRRLLEVAGKIQMSVLGALGAGLLLYGLGTMMHKIEDACNDIWRVTEGRSLLRRLRNYVAVLMLGPGLLAVSAAMTDMLGNLASVGRFFKMDMSGCETAFRIGPYFLATVAFTALYLGAPNGPVRVRPALIAGLVTGTAWKILGILFSIFVSGSSSYAEIYSVFAALVLFMIWIYAGWFTVLAGASLCYYLQYPSNQPVPRHGRHVSLRVREKLALQTCAVVGERFYRGAGAPDAETLSAELGVPAIVAQEVAGELVASGVLAESSDRRFIPARPFDEARVEDMLDGFRACGEAGALRYERIRVPPGTAHVLKDIEKSVHRELGKMTLKQLSLGSKTA
jgi:membrane protein